MSVHAIVPMAVSMLLVISFVLYIIGLATPEWFTFLADEASCLFRLGLFQVCCGKCQKIEESTADSKIKAAQATGLLAAIFLLVATVTAFVSFVKQLLNGSTVTKNFKVCTLFAGAAAIVFMIICFAVLAKEAHIIYTPFDIGLSMALSITAAVLTFLACVLRCMEVTVLSDASIYQGLQ